MKGRVVPVESGRGRRSNTGEPTAACGAEPTRGTQPPDLLGHTRTDRKWQAKGGTGFEAAAFS